MTKDEAKWLMETLRNIQFFSIFSLENIDSVLKLFQKYTYPKGKSIIIEGESGKAFFVVHTGKVKVFKRKVFWMKQQLALLGPGDFFGEMALVSEEPAAASIVPVESTEAFVLLKSDFQSILKSNPKLGDEIRRIAEKRKFENLKRN